MSAATENKASIAVGDRIFIHPDELRTPIHLRGRTGTVVSMHGGQMKIQLRDGELVLVDPGALRLDRRRKR